MSSKKIAILDDIELFSAAFFLTFIFVLSSESRISLQMSTPTSTRLSFALDNAENLSSRFQSISFVRENFHKLLYYSKFTVSGGRSTFFESTKFYFTMFIIPIVKQDLIQLLEIVKEKSKRQPYLRFVKNYLMERNSWDFGIQRTKKHKSMTSCTK